MITPGLSRITALLQHTPLPWAALHVAGTNGKGSVCATITALLDTYNASALRRATGHPALRHGRFTTPHLLTRADSIAIDGVPISDAAFAAAEASVLSRAGGIGASEFELLTATAFEVFTARGVDVGVIEVGMGGRLDATNVLGHEGKGVPIVTGITDVGMDHTEFLGETLEEIAAEKAGIVKRGVPVVAAGQRGEVERVVERRAAEMQAELVFVTRETTLGDLWRQHGEKGEELGRDGERVVQTRWANGAVALSMTWKALKQLGRLDGASGSQRADMMREFGNAINKVVWHGRLETINVRSITGYDFDVVLDGAHNDDSARMLRQHLDATGNGSTATSWIVGSSSSKKIGGILKLLLHPKDSVHAVGFPPVDGMPWIKPVEGQTIVDAASALSDPSPQSHQVCVENLENTLKTVCAEAVKTNRRVVVTGSLYLISEVFRIFNQQDEKR